MLKSRARRVAALTVGAAFLLAAAGCGTEKSDEPTGTQKVRLYGTDGNMLSTFHEEFQDQVNLLEGMKGSAPATPLTDDFKNRLRSVDPNIDGYTYAAETYDAVVITALAAELARSPEPARIAAQINGVTVGGQSCTTAANCLALARKGTDIRYRGPSLRGGGFTDAGEPATASYATLHFDRSGKLNDAKTEYLGAGDDSTVTDKRPPSPGTGSPGHNAQLKLGELLPKTGELALAYPPMATGAALALKEINDAGGVFGKPVVWVEGDDGTNPEVAKATVRRHVEAGVQVIIGAGASGISRAVLPDVVEAGVILFSSSNTDAGLSTVEDNGLYFRTAPPDNLQGRALADMILRDGPQEIAIVARNDSYGVGLQENVHGELERAGVSADRIKLMTYEPPADADAPPVDFSAGAEEIKQFGADAVLIIGFGESAAVIKALAAAGVEIQN
ncbi:MAG TPA: ABC transporter substrate-binding protein [Micromonospora sp.]|nr:ABC transporter substrate-binding protein [Micromonospora sp.]